MRKHFGILVGAGMLILALSPVPSQAGIKVAVWEESFASGSTGYNTVNADPIVELLNDGDHPGDFEGVKVTKAQIEAGILESDGFDVLLVGGREYVRWSDTMAAQVKHFVVDLGGGYVGMGWGVTYSTQGMSSQGYADLRAFQPTTQTNSSYHNRNGGITFATPDHPIVEGLSDYTPTQENCCALITGWDSGGSWQPRPGATVVARSASTGEPLIIADLSGNGRGVYFGVNIGSYNIYADRVDADTETLMENALLWSVCTQDEDGDGVCDFVDNCPADENADQSDRDLDGLGDICDCAPDDNMEPGEDGECPGCGVPLPATLSGEGRTELPLSLLLLLLPLSACLFRLRRSV